MISVTSVVISVLSERQPHSKSDEMRWPEELMDPEVVAELRPNSCVPGCPEVDASTEVSPSLQASLSEINAGAATDKRLHATLAPEKVVREID